MPPCITIGNNKTPEATASGVFFCKSGLIVVGVVDKAVHQHFQIVKGHAYAAGNTFHRVIGQIAFEAHAGGVVK